jgi:uncharacterized phage-associated protein
MGKATVNINKVGLILWILAKEIQNLSMTKALKLIYILDETSVKRVGSPITWLDYYVWKHGPVATDLYNTIRGKSKLSNDPVLLSYVRFDSKFNEDRNHTEICIIPVGEHDLNCLSEYEHFLLYEILGSHGLRSASNLIDFLHKEGSRWSHYVKNHQIEFKDKSSTDIIIDFRNLLSEKEAPLFYDAVIENDYYHNLLSN